MVRVATQATRGRPKSALTQRQVEFPKEFPKFPQADTLQWENGRGEPQHKRFMWKTTKNNANRDSHFALKRAKELTSDFVRKEHE